MNFKDQMVTNAEGDQFIFTVEMQRRLVDAGLPVEPESLEQLPNQQPVVQRAPAPASQDAAKPAETFAEPQSVQIDPQTGKYIGRMKWYNLKKGYGFLMRGGGEEIFFHKSGTVGDPGELREGQWVLYDVEETHKGPEATEIEPYDGEVNLEA